MKRFAYALAALVFLLDQLVKYWIVNVVQLQERITIPVLPFFSLTWVENRGVSMGMMTADTEVGRWLLVGLTALIATVVALWIRRERHWPESVALGLILGGALGNIVDRVRFGYVVDFVHLHWGPWSFYVFNVADAAITIGVLILLFRALIGRSDGNSERLPNA
ncbi:signal peptidase II [Sandaracinobacter neustonicus]|uniref:Lipoprotein signal peptidase n=1 Tax=Sandaracinobacter neustonicus TaxID=1715348 RepID=A0A501XEZ0_9SPHN|nr:signal peptidase II [Sandaracinobacter neustonicus]TPE59105.1 signal peptidase II [Sandaracinobacter neustonicus]